ncbi:MAG: methyltransferase domain-containing protein [Acidobacteriota bacterium]
MTPPSHETSSLEDAELERIRSEYLRRSREIPKDYYWWNRPVNLYIQCQLTRAIIAALDSNALFPLNGRRVADIGCGSGVWLLEFAQWGAPVSGMAGIDLDEHRLGQAKQQLGEADLHRGSAAQLPWADESFDLVTQFTLFSSILDPNLKAKAASEMLRVLKADGAILWYDLRLNNPSNSQVRGIGLEEIRSLFPNCRVQTKRVTLAPPLARAVVPYSWSAAALLENVPFLRTHHLHVIRKAGATSGN